MALSSTTLSQPVTPTPEPAGTGNLAAPVLGALMVAIFAAQRSKKGLRQLRKAAVTAVLKYKVNNAVNKVRSFFSKGAPATTIDNRTLLYILLGVAFLILLFVYWPAAIALLLLGILLVLLTKK